MDLDYGSNDLATSDAIMEVQEVYGLRWHCQTLPMYGNGYTKSDALRRFTKCMDYDEYVGIVRHWSYMVTT